ncbi:MAG TPA: cytochrome c3 family protein, partial [Longimicrobiales bacterium]|nr:cytochrome c3 family protein [Longimicrobiales bacterium]
MRRGWRWPAAASGVLRRARPRPWALLALALLGIGLGGGAVLATAAEQDEFPHDVHVRLFPLCTGCHEGVETSDPSAYYPPPASCATCHDGVELTRVGWQAPTDQITNLDFTHEAHALGVRSEGMEPLDCERCHTPEGAPRMHVELALPAQCLSCHEHQARNHYVDADCATCHVTLAATGFSGSRVLALPLPADHDVAGFLLERHGTLAAAEPTRCATCHTRERCTSCHVDVRGVEPIAALPAAPAGFPLPRYAANYPEPASHRTPEWMLRHGNVASRESCGACHTRDDCATCHVEPLPGAAAELPSRRTSGPGAAWHEAPGVGGAGVTAAGADEGAARIAAARRLEGELQEPTAGAGPGVGLTRRMPVSHAPRSFLTDHATLAAARPQQCAACHTQRFCTDCHNAPETPGFHPRNYTAKHASESYGRRLECATCHEVRTFCRSCHIQQGMGADGRLDPGFHDAQPLWLLRHAQAARQGLESCTSCHTQRDC